MDYYEEHAKEMYNTSDCSVKNTGNLKVWSLN